MERLGIKKVNDACIGINLDLLPIFVAGGVFVGNQKTLFYIMDKI